MTKRIGKGTGDWKGAVWECVQMREELKVKNRRMEVNYTKRNEECQNRGGGIGKGWQRMEDWKL